MSVDVRSSTIMRGGRPALERSAVHRGLTVTLLGLTLVMAQVWLAVHELEHVFNEPEEPCHLCIVGLGLGAPLPPAAPLPTVVAADITAERLDGGVTPHSRDYHPQAARAPPARASMTLS